MPVIARFYGIIIRMYFSQSEHNPPHIHAIYSGNIAAISIYDNKILEGKLPQKALQLVFEWINMYRQELIDIWSTQVFKELPPLD